MRKVEKSTKLAQGTLYRSREKQSIAFAPLTDMPKVPETLKPEAVKYFTSVCRLLLSNGSLTAGNIPDITMAAIWWGIAREAEDHLSTDGPVQTAQSGYMNISPYISALEKATNQLKNFSDRYGLSLLSKTKVGVQDTKKENPFDDI